MLTSLLKRQVAKFGKRHDYDTSYLRDLIETDASGALKLAFATGFTDYRFGLPAAPYFAAKATGTRWADCGSCLRLVIAEAEEAGVPRSHVASLLAGQSGTAPEAMELAHRYARAVIENGPELPDLLADCERRWSRRGVAGLAAATVSGLFYPLFKRGLGYGNACEPVMFELATLARRQEEIAHA